MPFEIKKYTMDEFPNRKEIERGGEGVVYKAEHDHFGEIVIKAFDKPHKKLPDDNKNDKDNYKEFKREIDFLQEHRHPNIVQIYGIIWDGFDKSVYLGYIMEYVKGGSLSNVIYNPAKSYDTWRICLWITQIGRGLWYLHKEGIIHRDIKPANILVADQLKLADFGIARKVDTSVTAGIGTMRYMAPEVIETIKYGPAADIYSLAITIWEIYHRKIPYDVLEIAAETLLHFLTEIINGIRPIIEPDKMDQNAAEFIQRCWLKDASKRPEIKEIVEYFEAKYKQLVPKDVIPFEGIDTRPGASSQTEEMILEHTILVTGLGDTGDIMAIYHRNGWRKLELTLPHANLGGGVVFLEDEIYLVGGGTNHKALQKLDEKYNWIYLTDMHYGRGLIKNSCLAWNGFIWIFGGHGSGRNDYLNSVERYDPVEDKWIELPPMTYPRTSAAAAVCNGKIIVCGGGGPNREVLDTVECFDPEGGLWVEFDNMPTPLAGHALVPYGNEVVIIGPYRGRNNCVYSITEENGRPKQLRSMDCFCVNFAGVTLENEIFVMGGYDQEQTELDRVEVFNGSRWRKGPSLPYKCVSPAAIVIPRQYADFLCRYH